MENEEMNINSKSETKPVKKAVNPKKLPKYRPVIIKNTGFKSLGNIVKVIAFVVAIAVLAVFVLAAYILFAFRPLYRTICLAIVTAGLIVSLIVLFLIYALGHTINQNNEILALLKSKDTLD